MAIHIHVGKRKAKDSEERIVGHSWEAIQRAQRGGALHEKLDLSKKGDHGADPVGNGKFRMVPSGDIVDLEERNKRLKR